MQSIWQTKHTWQTVSPRFKTVDTRVKFTHGQTISRLTKSNSWHRRLKPWRTYIGCFLVIWNKLLLWHKSRINTCTPNSVLTITKQTTQKLDNIASTNRQWLFRMAHANYRPTQPLSRNSHKIHWRQSLITSNTTVNVVWTARHSSIVSLLIMLRNHAHELIKTKTLIIILTIIIIQCITFIRTRTKWLVNNLNLTNTRQLKTYNDDVSSLITDSNHDVNSVTHLKPHLQLLLPIMQDYHSPTTSNETWHLTMCWIT